MLFIFDTEDKYGIWMENMSFPIDIIWISADKQVVDIKTNAQACVIDCETYSPQENALYVLEVNAGFVEKNGVAIGDTVDF